jgi:hypothetical protein
MNGQLCNNACGILHRSTFWVHLIGITKPAYLNTNIRHFGLFRLNKNKEIVIFSYFFKAAAALFD